MVWAARGPRAKRPASLSDFWAPRAAQAPKASLTPLGGALASKDQPGTKSMLSQILMSCFGPWVLDLGGVSWAWAGPDRIQPSWLRDPEILKSFF